MAKENNAERVAVVDKGTLKYEVFKDFGSFGDGKWSKHLTLTKWGDNDPKYDIRAWSEDWQNCSKGITLDDGELYDLMSLIENVLDGEDTEE